MTTLDRFNPPVTEVPRLSRDPGGDSFFGSRGDDRIWGRRGNDFLHGGSGTDAVHGGRGTDTCVAAETVAGCEL